MADTTSTINFRPPVWLPILVVIIGGGFYLAGKHLEIRSTQQNPATISVSGDAKVSASPDIAVLSFGVATGRQSSAKSAVDLLKKHMTSILDAVKKAGVEEKDIATENFWLNPAYDYLNGTQVPRGFEATQTLSVKVRDLDTVGDVLGAATAAGANQAGGITFSIDEPDTLRAQAREKAIDEAKEKAEVLARSLGMHLGRIVGFSEDGSVPPRPMMMAKTMEYGMGGGGDASLPLPAGQQDIVSTVSITYELR
jgi:uncharacterized protein